MKNGGNYDVFAGVPFLSPSRAQIPPSPSPFNACHAGYSIYKSGERSDPASTGVLACEQAHRGALVAGREKEGELAATSVEFEYLYRKSRCERMIGDDDISNDVITLGTYFSMFVYIRSRFRFALIGGNLNLVPRAFPLKNGWKSPRDEVAEI